ncbi:hypothetical protein RRG08_050285 [Elysia crispata]|uniref:Uncharacterized protein n=1 Tax=Elysia crispata TaxID=231223 RepID=A0AAE1B4R0_9GAST|nr:hypothetical protein RRG08_050285 [Elysia crispata]
MSKPIQTRGNASRHKGRSSTYNLPRDHDEAVEPVPGLSQVCVLSPDPHGHHLDEHLDGEEGEDKMVEALQQPAPDCGTHLVAARLVHAEGHAVQDDYAH